MEICLEIEVHVYAGGRLCDEYLVDDTPCGVLAPEAVLPLRRNKKCKLYYSYSESTTAGDAIQAILKRIECDREDILDVGEYCVWFLHKTERYQVSDKSITLYSLLRNYLDLEESGKVLVQILVSADAGAICCDEGIRYYMHSHEAGKHNEPHVHVEDTGHNYEASIALSDGRILAGEFPRKLLKKAQKKIYEDNAYFYECWQAKTDGLIPDINHHYGYIKY